MTKHEFDIRVSVRVSIFIIGMMPIFIIMVTYFFKYV